MSRSTFNAGARPRAFAAALAACGALTVAAMLTPAPAAAAQPDAGGLQMSVYYTWQDLASERGTRALYRRIVNAAAEVCPGADSLNHGVALASEECQRTAIARAIGQIGSARLAAVDAKAVARAG